MTFDTRCQAIVSALATASIGGTFNQYREGPRAQLLRRRLAAYLDGRSDAAILLVGEAAGLSRRAILRHSVHV